MSVIFELAASRLTVLGSGWNNSSINSGDGLTEDGKLWEDIAGNLGYDYGDNVDWDNLSSDREWSEEVITDENGNRYIPKNVALDLEAMLKSEASKDSSLLRYSVPANVVKTLYSGMVSQETEWDETDTERPHSFYPDVYYIQLSEKNACLFQEEAFWHKTANGGNITVNDKSITIRTGSSMKVYWSECLTHFDSNYLPSPYNTYPVEYVCWQCLWGSFQDMLIRSSEAVKTMDEVFGKTVIDGKAYYAIGK